MLDVHTGRLRAARNGLFASCAAILLAANGAWAATEPPPPPPIMNDDPLVLVAPIGLESVAVANQVIRDNVVVDIGGVRRTLIESSGADTRGIVQINQDVGAASNQANMLLLTLGAGAGNTFQDSNTYAARAVTGNTLTVEGGQRINLIQNSFNNAQGYVQINQNSGNLNAQLNIGNVSLAAGLGNGFAMLNDTSLAGVVVNNTYNTTDTTTKADVINGGFDGFRGVAQITQASGDGNAIGNSVAIGVTVLNVK